jgi:hypothetical protein
MRSLAFRFFTRQICAILLDNLRKTGINQMACLVRLFRDDPRGAR